jgi:formylglycine-generating enzyme required for sulfatase activity
MVPNRQKKLPSSAALVPAFGRRWEETFPPWVRRSVLITTVLGAFAVVSHLLGYVDKINDFGCKHSEDWSQRTPLRCPGANFPDPPAKTGKALEVAAPAPPATTTEQPKPTDDKASAAASVPASPLTRPVGSLGQDEINVGNGEVFKECEKCPEMTVVPIGSFIMGSPMTEPERERYIKGLETQRRVTIRNRFAVGRFAVTFDEWDACVAQGGCNGYVPSDHSWGRGKLPVINVSWSDAKAYVAWLSKKTGAKYRLLTESEREYVTRAGTTTTYWWGMTISADQANYNPNSKLAAATNGIYRERTVAVDSFSPNPWGLYQVHGNVLEWVDDCWSNSASQVPTDGSAYVTDCRHRVLRGGAHSDSPAELRAAYKEGYAFGMRNEFVGFRVARTLK